MNTPVHVLVIDDDWYARDAIAGYLAKDRRTRVFGTAASVDQAVVLLLSDKRAMPLPNVILTDVCLGADRRGGIDGVPALRAASPESQILIYSVSRDEETVGAAFAAGADGYVWKPEAGEGIATAIVRAAEGFLVSTPAINEAIVRCAIDLRAGASVTLHGERRYADLSERLRKTALLYCMAGMSKAEIAREFQVSEDAIKSRIKDLFAILGARSREEAFQTLVERDTGAR